MNISRPEKSLLRGEIASNATAQQTPINGASSYATAAQQAPHKPASLLDIARNKLRNSHATTTEKDAQQAPFLTGEFAALVARDDPTNKPRNNQVLADSKEPINTGISSLLRVACARVATAQQAQPEQEAELRRLVALVAAAHTFTPAEQSEALRNALGNPEAALRSFRVMAAELHRELRRAKVLALLQPGDKYALLVEDAATDPVSCWVAIRGKATFEMEIPKRFFDGMMLLQLIETHSQSEEL